MAKNSFSYFSFKNYLTQKYGYPLYRVPIDLALSCPHKKEKFDGCMFCAEDGARAIHLAKNLNLKIQVQEGIEYIEKRYNANGNYIAYFQAYTSTNTDIDTLKKMYNTVLALADFKMIIVATRPDCLPDSVISFLSDLNKKCEVWVELGVQTANDDTLKIINRGHSFKEVKTAVKKLNQFDIKTAAHIILGLPGETHKDYCHTINELNKLPFSGIKIHNLLLLKKSPLAQIYNRNNISKQTGEILIPGVGKIKLMNEFEYAGVLIDFIRRIPKDRPILRVNADASPKEIIGPKWNISKGQFIELVKSTMTDNNFSQGDFLNKKCDDLILEKNSLAYNPISYLKVKTLDDSFTFYNPIYKENYHSVAGAEAEALQKFIKPSKLEVLLSKNKTLHLLDIGFGLGYNAIAAIKTSINTESKISITSLEMDNKTLDLAKAIFPFDSLESKIINSLSDKMKWANDSNKIQLLLGDARQTINRCTNICFDIIFLDAFSPLKNPELWTYDFLKILFKIMSKDAILVTYSAAFAVRGALIKCGFHVGTTEPFGRKKGGTIASKNSINIETPLTETELNIIQKSTAGTPYRDKNLNCTAKQIFNYRDKLTKKLKANGIPKWYK